ncbi:MAG: DUF5702 domain-containing protein [Lachnospiraceae bacterium]|nr:DUF5702 domain-containing protein [Lachnospiraceae bacterium]
MKPSKINNKISGYLTVFLTLILAALLPLCMLLIEGVRIRAIYFEAECVSDIGINSIFAEYHRELFKQYNIFAVDCSYGTNYASEVNTEQHLKEYLDRNISYENIFLSEYMYRDYMGLYVNDAELTKVSFLTDEKGSVLKKSAVDAVKDDIGIETLEQLKEWLSSVESENLDMRNAAEEKRLLDEEIEELVEEAQSDDEEEIIKEDGTIEIVPISYEPYVSPTNSLEDKRNKGIIKYVVENTEELSCKSLNTEGLISARIESGNINKGNFNQDDTSSLQEITESFFFNEYLLRYMNCYVNINDGQAENVSALKALDYEIEYLIAGKASDLDNLRSVINRLCMLREAANAVYIFSDEIKCKEAEVLAAIIAVLVQAPDIEPLLRDSILLGWAYAESLYDIRVLLAGGRVPLIKDEKTWHYSLQGALEANDSEYGDCKEGLSYEDYMRIFMLLTNEDTLTERAMNIIEANIRLTEGNKAFRLDACISEAEVAVKIASTYGYSCEVTRKKAY